MGRHQLHRRQIQTTVIPPYKYIPKEFQKMSVPSYPSFGSKSSNSTVIVIFLLTPLIKTAHCAISEAIYFHQMQWTMIFQLTAAAYYWQV